MEAMMMKLVTGMFSGLVLSQTVLAEPPAVYQDGVLTIHGGAVINAEGFNTYYRNIQLQADETGAFRIVGVEAAELADVETVNVLVTENEMSEVEVVVSGTKSACVEIEEPAVAQFAQTFVAVLPESEPESDVCIQSEVNVAEDYEFSFPLDVSGVEGGDYTIVVNGVEAEFSIEGNPDDELAGTADDGLEGAADDDVEGDDAPVVPEEP
jgi:hypothetical protein